jgi:protein-disulfide isomerase
MALSAAALCGLAACAQQSSTAAAPGATGPITTVAADGVSAPERAAIEAIVRELMVKDPTIVADALKALAAQERIAMRERIENVSSAHSIGPADAPVTIVELFDYRCGYCKSSMEWLFSQAAQNPGRMRIVFKEYPILSEGSYMAAKAALAAREQGKYVELHQALMRSTGSFTDAEIDAVAKSVGVDVPRMRREMESPAVQAEIERVAALADAEGVRGTPAFFVNGELVPGFDKDRLEELVQEVLSPG